MLGGKRSENRVSIELKLFTPARLVHPAIAGKGYHTEYKLTFSAVRFIAVDQVEFQVQMQVQMYFSALQDLLVQIQMQRSMKMEEKDECLPLPGLGLFSTS